MSTVGQIELKKGKIEALITKTVAGKRYLLKRLKAKPEAMFIYWNDGAYYCDLTRVFLLDKRPLLLFDVDIAEPLELDFGNGPQSVEVHMPLNPSLRGHSSHDLELLMKHQAVRQSLGALSGGAGMNSMTIMMLIIGLAAGAPLGYIIGLFIKPSATPPATNSTVTHTVTSSTTTAVAISYQNFALQNLPFHIANYNLIIGQILSWPQVIAISGTLIIIAWVLFCVWCDRQ